MKKQLVVVGVVGKTVRLRPKAGTPFFSLMRSLTEKKRSRSLNMMIDSEDCLPMMIRNVFCILTLCYIHSLHFCITEFYPISNCITAPCLLSSDCAVRYAAVRPEFFPIKGRVIVESFYLAGFLQGEPSQVGNEHFLFHVESPG